MVMVQSSCDELSVQTQAVSPTKHVLVFKTWREPSVQCEDSETPRTFQVNVFAPITGVEFIATLDGTNLPFVVLPVTTNR
jgi:hypothetical protein